MTECPYRYGGEVVPRSPAPTWHYHRILQQRADQQDTWIRCKQIECLFSLHTNYYDAPIWHVRADERLSQRLKEQDLHLENILIASVERAIANRAQFRNATQPR